MRFQDAARTPGRSSTPGSRRTRSSRGRGPARRRDARRAGPRAGRHERRVDRTATAGGRCSRPCSGPTADADAGDPARSEAILAASLAVADRGEQVRSQVRGALVEELTARLLARRAGRERRPPRAAHPVRRRPGGDPPVRRDRRARRRGRGVRLQVGRARHQRRRPPPARRRAVDAADEDETLAVALVVFDARRSCDVRLARQTAPHEATRARDARDARRPGRSRAVTEPRSEPARRRTASASTRPAGRAAPDVGPAAVRPGRGLASLGRCAGSPRAWYAERGLHVARPGGRGRGPRADRPSAAELIGTTRVVGWRRVWARRRTDFVDDGGLARRRGPDRLGPARRARGADADPGRVRAGLRRRADDGRAARVDLGEVPAARRALGRARSGPQELDPMDHVNNAVYADWLDEAILGDRRRGWRGDGRGPAARPARVRARRLPARRGRRCLAGRRRLVVPPVGRGRRPAPGAARTARRATSTARRTRTMTR